MNSTTLRAWQDRLRRLGLYPAPGDGEFGPMTEAAIDAVIALAEARAGVKPPAFPHLPAAYAWLNSVSPLPRSAAVALAMLGTKEIPGKANSPAIMSWAAEAGLTPAQYPNDEVAWCGLAVAVVLKRAGKPIDAVGNILSSRAWIKFGEASPVPGLGDVLVFWRGSPSGWQGHVGIYVGEDDRCFHVAGGNQSNAFTIARVEKSRLVGARRPTYRNPPPTAKPYRVAATGAVSRNEA